MMSIVSVTVQTNRSETEPLPKTEVRWMEEVQWYCLVSLGISGIC